MIKQKIGCHVSLTFDTVVNMARGHEVLTAEELDAMTPDERAAAFDKRIVRDLDRLPALRAPI